MAAVCTTQGEINSAVPVAAVHTTPGENFAVPVAAVRTTGEIIFVVAMVRTAHGRGGLAALSACRGGVDEHRVDSREPPPPRSRRVVTVSIVQKSSLGLHFSALIFDLLLLLSQPQITQCESDLKTKPSKQCTRDTQHPRLWRRSLASAPLLEQGVLAGIPGGTTRSCWTLTLGMRCFYIIPVLHARSGRSARASGKSVVSRMCRAEWATFPETSILSEAELVPRYLSDSRMLHPWEAA